MGFLEIHRKGSHVKMEHSDGRRIVFPYHDEVDRFTLKGALGDASVNIDEFCDTFAEPLNRKLRRRALPPRLHEMPITG